MGDNLDIQNKNEKEEKKEAFLKGCPPPQYSSIKSLVPLKAQVGGHTSIRLYSDTLVGKPLVPREVEFYRQLPRELRDFVPYFGGVLSTYSRTGSPTRGKKTRRR